MPTTIDTSRSRSLPEDHKGLIKSGRFPRSPSTINIPLTVDGTPDNGDDTNEENGLVLGDVRRCFRLVPVRQGSGADSCSVQYTGASYIVGAGTWTFRTSKSAKVGVPDASYMNFGWWRKQIIDSGAFSYGVFSNTGTGGNRSGYSDLERTATYEGPAIGQYAIYQPLGTQSNHGSFKATARLSANFDTDKISGAVTGFDVNSDWTVTLTETAISVSSSIGEGDVSWTIDGNTEDGGNWNGKFHSEIDSHVDTYPDGVAGTFDAKYADVGRMVGAFGAHKK